MAPKAKPKMSRARPVERREAGVEEEEEEKKKKRSKALPDQERSPTQLS